MWMTIPLPLFGKRLAEFSNELADQPGLNTIST